MMAASTSAAVTPLLDILIVTQPSRAVFLNQLMSILAPQIRWPIAQVTIYEGDLDLPIGDRRERIRRASIADYICFVDDDDLVAPDYVSRIHAAIDDAPAPDIIGWESEVWLGRTKMAKRDLHTLAGGGWYDTDDTCYRDISHLNPIRRELALAVAMEGGVGEDRRWADGMRAAGVVKRESFLHDTIPYYYLYRPVKNDAVDATDPWRLAMIERVRNSVCADSVSRR